MVKVRSCGAVLFGLLAACGSNRPAPTAPAPDATIAIVPVDTSPPSMPVASGLAEAARPEPTMSEAPPPAPSASVAIASAPVPPGDSCGLRAKLRPLPSTDGFVHYALTLTNAGKKPVRLVLPGDGSEVGWRTPILTWNAMSNGKPAAPAEAARCGMSNAIAEDEIFVLAPGASREIKDWLGYPRFVPGTYDVSVRYRNDPTLAARKAAVAPDVAQKLAATSACDVTSNAVRTTLPSY